MEKAMKRLTEGHREKMALFERQFLETKQQLLRGISDVVRLRVILQTTI
jgi:hypothetical protein